MRGFRVFVLYEYVSYDAAVSVNAFVRGPPSIQDVVVL